MASILPRLIVRDTFGNEREVEISRTPFSLGRQNDNDLVLLDNRISRCHAHILQKGDEYLIEDASSRHGTFVNGERVVSHLLKPGEHALLVGRGIGFRSCPRVVSPELVGLVYGVA